MVWSRQSPCVLLSIESTGTRFVKRMLERAGSRGVRQTHIDPDQIHGWWELVERHSPIFVTIRHPYSTVVSWLKRGWPIKNLPKRWDLMVDRIDALDPYYIPIDAANRGQHLEDLEGHLGFGLDPGSWRPVGVTQEEHDYTFGPEAHKIVTRTLRVHGDFWERWYALEA